MKRVVFLLLFFICVINCFGQFEDTASLNAFIRDTIKDRRPDKVTAAQLQKGMLGITQFLAPISVSFPVTYNDGQIGIQQATSTTNGYLSANDWSTFNNKLGGTLENFTTVNIADQRLTFSANTTSNQSFNVQITNSDNGNTGELQVSKNGVRLFNQQSGQVTGLYINGGAIQIQDQQGNIGMMYTNNNYAAGQHVDRWIPDLAAVRTEISDSVNTVNFKIDSIISRLIIMQPFQPAGTIEVTSGNDLVQGHSTKFLSEFNQGDTIQANGQECVVMTIVNDSVLYTIDLWAADYSGVFSISANTGPRFRFALNPNGNMGIGTSEPQDKLEIVGNNINGALSPAIRFTDNSGEGGYSRILYDRAEGALYFLNGASDGRFSFNRRVSINGNISAHNLDAGTWSPVISAESNVSGSTISECRYSMFGDIITISGVITLGTTTDDEASLEFDLPYFSAFVNASDLSGSGSDVTLATPVHFSLSANTATGNAKLNIKDVAGSTTGAKFSFTAQFIVLEPTAGE